MTNRLLYLARHGEQDHAAADDDGPLGELGRRQSERLGERLRDVPFSAIHHSPLRGAAQTAELIARLQPGVPTIASDLLLDCAPSAPERGVLSPVLAEFVDGFSAAELDEGPVQAAAALERFARPAGDESHELIVTHNFLIGAFVCHALDAPDWRWLLLNQLNCGLTIIQYRADRPPSLVSYNDIGHLPPELRSSGHPVQLLS